MTTRANPSDEPRDDSPAQTQHDKRDGESLLIMGGFFVVLAVAVMLGTQWDQWNEPVGVINIAASLALALVGVVMFVAGRVIRHRRARQDR